MSNSQQGNTPGVTQPLDADHFTFKVLDLEITYRPISRLHRGPYLELRRKSEQPRKFARKDIELRESRIGTLVTVVLERRPDLPTETLTLLAPTTLLVNEKTTAITTIVIFTTDLGTAFRVPTDGPLETYRVVEALGEATYTGE